MNKQYDINYYLKKLQEALVGIVAVISSLVTLIIAARGEPTLIKLIIAIVILVILIIVCLFIAFSRTKQLVYDGKGPFRYEKYRQAAIIGLSVIVGIILAFISLRCNRDFVLSAFSGDANYSFYENDSKQICDQIVITPEYNRIKMDGRPNSKGEYEYESVAYEFQAPADTGIEILFHKAQHLIIDGEREHEIVMGRHLTHADTYIPAGKTLEISDGVQLGKYDGEEVAKYDTVLFTHRVTFSIISDQGLYCEKETEFEVEMSGVEQ